MKYILLLFAIFSIVSISPAWGELQGEKGESEENELLWTPPKVVEQIGVDLSRIAQLVSDGPKGELEAVQKIVKILEQPDSFYFNKGRIESSHRQAEKLIDQLSPQGFKQYQNIARLDVAPLQNKLNLQDIDAQINFYSRFGKTPEGAEVAFNIAKYFHDRGKPDIARVYYQKVIASSLSPNELRAEAEKAFSKLVDGLASETEMSEEYLIHLLYESAFKSSPEEIAKTIKLARISDWDKLKDRVLSDTSTKADERRSLLEAVNNLISKRIRDSYEVADVTCKKLSDKPIKKIWQKSEVNKLVIQDAENNAWNLNARTVDVLEAERLLKSVEKITPYTDAPLIIPSQDGSKIVACKGNKVQIFDSKNNKILSTVKTSDSPVVAIDISNENNLLAVGHKDRTVELFDLPSGTKRESFKLDSVSSSSLVKLFFGKNASNLYMVNEDGLRSYDLKGNEQGAATGGPTRLSAEISPKKNLYGIQEYSLDFKVNQIALDKYKVGNYDVQFSAPMPTTDKISVFAFSTDESTLAVASHTGRIGVWPTYRVTSINNIPLDLYESWKESEKNHVIYSLVDEPITAICFGANARQIVVGTQSGKLCIATLSTDRKKGKSIRPAFYHKSPTPVLRTLNKEENKSH